jgi:hypothetical protein
MTIRKRIIIRESPPSPQRAPNESLTMVLQR